MLGKRDPQGYFVIVAKKEALDLLPKEASVEEAGDSIIIKIKSRSLAQKLLKRLQKEGLLVNP